MAELKKKEEKAKRTKQLLTAWSELGLKLG